MNEPGGDRTPDPRIKSPLLYRLSYRPKSVVSLTQNRVRIKKSSCEQAQLFLEFVVVNRK